MEIIIRGRQERKTSDLIKKCDGLGGYIVCHSQSEASRIYSMAHEMGCEILYPITYRDFVTGNYDITVSGDVYIDNAEVFLMMISKADVKGITISDDDGVIINNQLIGEPGLAIHK